MSAQSPIVDSTRELIGFNELVALLHTVFVKHGTSPDVAAILAHNCASAERDGAHSHGVFRMPGYLSTLASGWVDGKAVPVVTDVASGFVRVDAANGFAQPALAAARGLLVDKARSAGIALLAIHNSHHFAAPRADGAPIVFDLATSAIAHGDVQIAARQGERLPPGMGVDSLGQPTQDPKAVLEGGALLPFGGHKGSALSMMVELLAAALTGGNFSFEFNWADHPGARTPWTGQLLIVIDPSKTAGQSFAERSQELVRQMHAAGLRRLPGDRRHRTRATSLEKGIAIEAEALAQLHDWAG